MQKELAPAFASRFLKAFYKIKKTKKQDSRCRRIKLAADAAMALAVGTRRAWSRAVIRRVLKARVYHARSRLLMAERKIDIYKKMKKKRQRKNMQMVDQGGSCQGVDRLRQIVPGGEAMDYCNLLDETAHYMNCLSTQVKVMQHIVGSLSM